MNSTLNSSEIFFVYIVEARCRASTLNRSGRNGQKTGRKTRVHWVDRMATEVAWGGQDGSKRKLQGGKTGKFEGGGIWVRLTKVENINGGSFGLEMI